MIKTEGEGETKAERRISRLQEHHVVSFVSRGTDPRGQ